MRALNAFIKKILSTQGYALYQPSKGIPWPLSYHNINRLFYFKEMMDYISNVKGDIVECGVGQGESLIMLASLVKKELKGRNIWGFDSFEGFPQPGKEDKSIRNAREGEWGDTSVYIVRNSLINAGLDDEFIESQINLVKGFFEKSLSKYTGSSIALLHLDVDLYKSYLTALNKLYPKVTKGGVILFDEYIGTIDHLHFPGAQKAINEFFKDNKSLLSRHPLTGKYYFIKK